MNGVTRWIIREGELELGIRSVLVGILNVTPDSFSDGGEFSGIDGAIRRAREMREEGAGIIDIGGESTRPGFDPVSTEAEIDRVVPAIQAIVADSPDCIISVDTTKSVVAQAALDAGARIVNDVSGLRADAKMAGVVSQAGSGVILMRNGREDEEEGPLLDRIRSYWDGSVETAIREGVRETAIILDPGIGFGTTRQEDLEILRGIEVLRSFGFPMMLGTSRKRITACPSRLPLDERVETTIATTVAGVAAGVEVFRVHDVRENARAVALADLIYRGGTLNE